MIFLPNQEGAIFLGGMEMNIAVNVAIALSYSQAKELAIMSQRKLVMHRKRNFVRQFPKLCRCEGRIRTTQKQCEFAEEHPGPCGQMPPGSELPWREDGSYK